MDSMHSRILLHGPEPFMQTFFDAMSMNISGAYQERIKYKRCNMRGYGDNAEMERDSEDHIIGLRVKGHGLRQFWQAFSANSRFYPGF
jgi:hypothetical protein